MNSGNCNPGNSVERWADSNQPAVVVVVVVGVDADVVENCHSKAPSILHLEPLL